MGIPCHMTVYASSGEAGYIMKVLFGERIVVDRGSDKAQDIANVDD
jgi:hypothetical protein